MFVVFAKIQCFGFGGDTLTGVVFEFTAFVRFHYHAPLDAQDLLLVDHCSVGAIGAGTGHFLSEQHGIDLTVDFELIIQQHAANFYHFFAASVGKQPLAIQLRWEQSAKSA